MEEQPKKPEFQLNGVWIPIELIVNENLNLEHGFLFTVIKMLDDAGGGCFASNQYLAQVMNKSESRISNYINDLKKESYIVDNGEPYEKRRMWVRRDYEETYSKKVNEYHQKVAKWKKERVVPKVSSYDQAFHSGRNKIKEKMNPSTPPTEDD